MKRQPNRSILLVFGGYDYHVHNGVVQYARGHGWDIRVAHAGSGQPLPERWQGDGMILCSPPLAWVEIFDELIEKSCVPTVVIQSDKANPRAGYIRHDERAIGHLAADYFINRGFRRFLWVGDNRRASGNLDRYKCFSEALAEAGFPCEIQWWVPSRSGAPLDVSRQLREAVRSAHPLPLALFAVSDLVAVRAIYACLSAGIRVPEDVAILGVDNDHLYGDSAPITLSSVDSQQEMKSALAAELLDRLMQGAPVPSEPVLVPPSEIVSRQSTDTMATEHPKVREAIDYIGEHFKEPILISEIGGQVGMSREGLRKAVRKSSKLSLADILMRKRIEEAKRLLSTTELKLEAVAKDSGLQYASRLCYLFRRDLGITPDAYRKQAKDRAN